MTGAPGGPRVTVNGRTRVLDPGATVADVVAAEVVTTAGVAVAVNESLVPRSRWSATALAGGDRIELLRAAQGG